jgi:hypothetical protein
MKTSVKRGITGLLAFFFSMMVLVSFGDEPSPPPRGGHGMDGNQGGADAPIGNGLYVLVSLALLYGGRTITKVAKRRENGV